MIDELNVLYRRDLDRIIDLLGKFPEDKLWSQLINNTNEAGIVFQHIAGNLAHYIGVGMGKADYTRDREKEFTNTGIGKKKLLEQLMYTREIVLQTLAVLPENKLDKSYPLDFPYPYNNRQMLIHLYGHLNYHYGQLNYLFKFAIGH